MSVGILTLLLFGSLLVLLSLGLPIAFSLGGIAFIFLVTVWHVPYYEAIYWDAIDQLNSYWLLTIPLFTFMACMLERSGIAEDLYIMIYRWIGRLAGGLAIGTVLISTLLAAMVGLSGVATVTMGIAAMPSMLRRGYDKHMVMGAIAAGGTLGVLIPPSVLMMVYSQVSTASPRGLFMGGIVPGLLLSVMFMLYIGLRSHFQPDLGPPLPSEEIVSWRERIISLRSVILPLILVLMVLGSIFMGMATVTESAAIGAAGSVLCALVNRKLNWRKFKEANYETLKLTCMIMFIIFTALSFTRAYVIIGAAQFLEEFFNALPFGRWGAMVIMQVALLILGCFLDPFGILMITMPAFLPVLDYYGFDLVWFGILFVVNMEMAYLTPPVGLNLFYMKGVAPEGTTMGEIYISVMPFVSIQLLLLALIMVFPQIVLWLPSLGH